MTADARGCGVLCKYPLCRPGPIATFRLACIYPLACLPALVRWKGAETCKVSQRAQSRCRDLSMQRVPPIFEARFDTALLPSVLCTEPEVARAACLGKPMRMTIHALSSASNDSLSSSRITTEIGGGVANLQLPDLPHSATRMVTARLLRTPTF